MMMFSQDNLFKARARSILLCLLMVLSTTAALATTASASQARTYTTNRDPHDVAIGDFNCDGANDIAVATDGTHTITVLWNDGNGDFSERQDIWVTANQDRDAEWDEFSNVQFIEVGEFTGDGAIDIVIFQRNNPFKTNDDGSPAGEPGNVTIIENGGCGDKTWNIGERFTHFWAWDLEVADLNDDGNDDILVLDLQADITTQRVVTYLSPITSNTQGIVTNLGPSQQNTYRAFAVGDWGESQVGGGIGGGGTCFDVDMWLLRSEGLDYATGQVTNPGHDDNVSVVEFNCQTNSFPLTYTFSTSPGVGEHVINMQTVTSQDLAVADMDGDGVADVLALNDENIENITYVKSSSSGAWSSPQLAYFGPYISWSLTIADLNGDQEPDFINPTIAYQQNSTDSAGGTSSNFFLNYPTTIQVTLSDGSGGHLSPLSYEAGRRPHTAEVGQLAGGSSSAPDIVVAHKNWRFGGWRDNFGWDGQYDTITVIEMDNKDLSVSGIEISPVDRYVGIVGEGTRDLNVTVTNTGMDVLNGQSATLDVELKIVDELNSTNQTVYSMDWDSPENKAGCGSGCSWSYIDYVDGNHHWIEQTTRSSGTGTDPDESQAQSSPNYLNPTDFMWSGETTTNSSGGEWTGYGANWDEAMVLEDVDLTGSDRAFMSVELYQDLGFGALGSADTNGFVVGDVWDDLAMIEVGSEETGWSLINCPVSAYLNGACYSRQSIWGGFDLDRAYKENVVGGYAEGLYYYGIYSFNTYYGWNNFTDEGFGTFDLSPWAGETIDLRFRFRTGFDGSISDDNESLWTGYDGFGVDNLTITKQNTAFFPNSQTQQTNIPLNNLGPGQDYVATLQADFLNDTTYRISATLSNNAWDEQSLNDEIVGYITPFNLFDPALERIEDFQPGGLYAQGTYPITATTNNWGNTEVDFDITATVFTADPSDVNCGTPQSVCIITFDNSTDGTRYTESNNPKGSKYNDTIICPTDLVFNNDAYWFGHPCQTATLGYGDAWENETLTITSVDLESLSGDFVSLNFEYYADTFYEVDSQGNIEPSDFMSLAVDFTKDSTTYNALVYGQWNDYNEDGTCQIDEDGNGIVNETNPIDFDEIEYIGDPRTTDGLSGNWNVFFNSEGLVKTTSIDLTHLYVLNTSSADSADWDTECISLANSQVDINFDFYSDDDGRNGINDGFKGVGINNITLKEFTFTEDAVYEITRTQVDADQGSTDLIAEHDFVSGVYMIEVETQFDNTSVGTPWYGSEELSTSNNIKRVIFDVKSVDITIGEPGKLACLDEVRLNCVLPIDNSLLHDWEISATNGVLEGDYIFYMDIFDETTNSLAHTVTAGPAQSLLSGQKVPLTFTPWDGYEDGHTYNISYRAELDDGTPSGEVRHFHATFARNIDVAILSDKTSGTSTIIEDLAIMGKTYTQFYVNDWDDYFKTNWFTHYDKIVLPWQSFNDAKDDGGAYYLNLADTVNNVNRKQVLTSYMSSGGTIQAHLAPHGSQIYGIGTGLSPRLPLGLNIADRNTANSQITYADMEVYDPYHPLMEDITISNFQAFDSNKVVANAALNAGSEAAGDVPRICSGNLDVAEFQPIIRDETRPSDVLLGLCSYGQGGMIISTIDVESNSENASSSDFALLKNMLDFHVVDYPVPFGKMRQGTDIRINGEIPDPALGEGYSVVYMKSNTELTFSYVTDSTATLYTDWIISGPTNWNEDSQAPGVTDHTDEATPTMEFCKEIGTQGACKQDEQWTITLWLHDENGASRKLSVTVETDDANADLYPPVSDAFVEIMGMEYQDNIEYIGTCNQNYPKYRITLDEDGQIPITFNASNSSDADAVDGAKGIERYEWEVFYDKPYNDPITTDANKEVKFASSGGVWVYTFGGSGFDSNGESYAGRNLTVDPITEVPQTPIKVRLTVYDASGKWDDDMEICFEVIPAGFGDEPPVVSISDNWKNDVSYNESYFNLTGTVLSGSDEGDLTVQISLDEETFDGAASDRQKAEAAGKFAQMKNLQTGDSFELSLNLADLYTNESVRITVYIRIYEFDPQTSIDGEKRWLEEQTLTPTDPDYVSIVSPLEINLDLKKCRGLVAPDAATTEPYSGRWVFISGGCSWEGDYKFINGEWIAPSVDDDGDGAQGDMNVVAIGLGAAVLVLIVILSLMFLRKSDDGMAEYKDFSLTGAMQEDPVEQYVQQLIAQGYPEDTARAYAAQYAAQAGLGGGAAGGQQQPAATQNSAMDAAYQQYYQQFISQGYDEQTAAAYAQQYAAAYVQQQG